MNKRNLVIIIVVVVVIIAAVLLWPNDPKKQIKKAYDTAPENAPTQNVLPITPDATKTIVANKVSGTGGGTGTFFDMLLHPFDNMKAVFSKKNNNDLKAATAAFFPLATPLLFNKNDDNNNDGKTGNPMPILAQYFKTASKNFPLKKGSKGNEVKVLQTYLNIINGVKSPLKVDGIFGSITEKNLQKLTNKKEVSITDYMTILEHIKKAST